jgi:ABC-2 type transport system permease protein
MPSPTAVLFRKECRVALRFPATWCVFAACASLVGLFFSFALRAAAGGAGTLPELFCTPLALAAPLPAAFFTMGLFARERHNGTLETLLTAPVTDTQTVLAKFSAACLLALVALALCLPVFHAYLRLAAPPPEYDPLALAAGWCAVAAATALWTALGTLFSLLCRHESAAGAATLIVGFGISLPVSGAIELPFDSALAPYSLVAFARGVADTRPLFAALSGTLFLLFLSVRVLESRRWLVSADA